MGAIQRLEMFLARCAKAITQFNGGFMSYLFALIFTFRRAWGEAGRTWRNEMRDYRNNRIRAERCFNSAKWREIYRGTDV